MRTARSLRLLLLSVLVCISACADSTKATEQDSAPEVDSTLAADLGPDGFVPGHAGTFMGLTLGVAEVFGQRTASLLVAFRPVVREDEVLEWDWTQLPEDHCGVRPAREDACKQSSECAPEQQCLASEYDADDKPVPGTLRCLTEADAVDVGSLALTGLSGGPHTLSFNSANQGSYTLPGSDGGLPPEVIAFDTTYQFSGDGRVESGVGAFRGSLPVGPAFSLESPALLPVMGMLGLSVESGQDLVLRWSGEVPESFVRIQLAVGGADERVVICRAKDDGEFTIPATILDGLGLNPIAIFNRLAISRIQKGILETEQAFARSKISAVQGILLLVEPAPAR